jgi:hypothetical protein
MNERNEGDGMDNWGEDNDEEESGDDNSDDEEIDGDDDNYDDVDDSENSESDEEEEEEKSGEKIDVEKFIHTFHNGDYDAEIDNELSTDRGLIVQARPRRRHITSPMIGEKGIELE